MSNAILALVWWTEALGFCALLGWQISRGNIVWAHIDALMALIYGAVAFYYVFSLKGWHADADASRSDLELRRRTYL